MDVKTAKFMLKDSTSPSPQVMEQNAYCNGFVDAIDQLKETGVKEASTDINGLLKRLMQGEAITPKMFAEVAIASTKWSEAIAKLSALLGEK